MNGLAMAAGALTLVASWVPPSRPLPTAQPRGVVSIHVRAHIDGRSRLTLGGVAARWHHDEFVAPGRHQCNQGMPLEPTYLDGDAWWPNWPDTPTCENVDCNCDSDTYTGLQPGLPDEIFTASLEPIVVRGQCQIVEQPSFANDFCVVIEFNDKTAAGPAWYEVILHADTGACGWTERHCAATVNTTGAAARIDSLGSPSLSANDLVLTVDHGPPGHMGVFFVGCYPTQIPFGEGYLCATGLQRRLGPVVQLDSSGHASRPLDFGDPLAPEAVISSGSVWSVQFWYRDPQPVGHGFNLSDAVRIQFCP